MTFIFVEVNDDMKTSRIWKFMEKINFAHLQNFQSIANLAMGKKFWTDKFVIGFKNFLLLKDY